MSALGITYIDPLVVIVVIVSAIYASYRGFVSETLSIVAWAAAAFATLYFGPRFAPLMRGVVSPPLLGLILGYALIFLVVLIPLAFASYRFGQSVQRSPVSTFDRAMGFAFGIVRGLAIVGLAYIAFCYLVPLGKQPDWMTEARLLPVVQASSEVLLAMVPDQHLAVEKTEKKTVAVESAVTPKPAPRHGAKLKPKKRVHKTYGNDERRALDRLIEATGNGGNSKP